MLLLVTGILLGFFILVLLVIVHELGHAIVARRNGVVVEEFGIGFPPQMWAKKLKNGILFTLNLIPLGGFVRLKGEHDSASGKGTYGAASYWQKTKILFAGVLMNWLVAVVLLSGLALVGLPKILPDQFSVPGDTTIVRQPLRVVSVVKDSPAEKAGLEKGDQLLRFNGAELSTAQDLANATKEHNGQRIELIYVRDGTEYAAEATLRSEAENQNGQGYLGVSSNHREDIRATWSAPIVGVGTTVQFTWATLSGVGQVLGGSVAGLWQSLSFNETTRQQGSQQLGQVSQSVAGPLGILAVIFPAAQQAGLQQVVFLTAIISLSLAVMNALPIPALDGGRWFMMTYYRLRKKELTKEAEEKIVGRSFVALLLLVILVTIADVAKFF